MSLQGGSMAAIPRVRSIDKMVEAMNDISTLPHIVTRAIEIASDPNSSTRDLHDVIETDAALSARILRCVNSSACALRHRITNLRHAITLLGTREIRRLAMTASVAELFRRDEEVGAYRRSGLWKHLVAVGLCARLIALRQKMADFEDAFMAGLLHDIGIVLEDQYAHDAFCRMVSDLHCETTLAETEQRHLGFDHTELGARVAERWRFPESVQAAIRFHHRSIEYNGPSRAIVQCVEVANLICTVKGYTSVGLKLVPLSRPAIDALALTRSHLAVLAEDLDAELAGNAALLDIEGT